MAALGVVPASRVAMDTSSLLIAFGPPLTFKAPTPKLIISDEFNKGISIINNGSFYTKDVGSPILEKQARLLVNGQSSSVTTVRNFSPFK